jgi:hypothetical protein
MRLFLPSVLRAIVVVLCLAFSSSTAQQLLAECGQPVTFVNECGQNCACTTTPPGSCEPGANCGDACSQGTPCIEG